MTILDKIAEKTRQRVTEEKRRDPGLPSRVIEMIQKQKAAGRKNNFPFEEALRSGELSFICEVKRASPSKGLIAPDFPYVDIAREYEAAGADAISVLTEPYWFKGDIDYLREIRREVSIPILRKDFTVDSYMIYQAKEAGADAVLLICSILCEKELRDYLELADRLGLSAVVEAHDADEIAMAVRGGARIIGVNNRNLGDFSVDMENSGRLRELVPAGTIFISESGVKGREDIIVAERMHADAVLIGEALMKAKDKKRKMSELRGSISEAVEDENAQKTDRMCEISDERAIELPRKTEQQFVDEADESKNGNSLEETGRQRKVKICGLRTPEEIEWANELMPDYVGFVFAPTKRQVTTEQAEKLRKLLDAKVPAVGVFVNEDEARIVDLMKRGIIDIAQLHGDEDDEEICRIHRLTGKPVIKAIVMRSEKDRDKWREYPHADLLLLDAGRGSGNTFDWALAKDVEKPFLLAGGLNSENVEEAMTQIQSTIYSEQGLSNQQAERHAEKSPAYKRSSECIEKNTLQFPCEDIRKSYFIGVDVSSGVENTGGGKNYSKMRLFIDKVRGKE